MTRILSLASPVHALLAGGATRAATAVVMRILGADGDAALALAHLAFRAALLAFLVLVVVLALLFGRGIVAAQDEAQGRAEHPAHSRTPRGGAGHCLHDLVEVSRVQCCSPQVEMHSLPRVIHASILEES